MRFPLPSGGGRRGGGGFSIWTILIVLALVWFFGGDLGSILGGGQGGAPLPRIEQTGTEQGGEVFNPFDIPGMPGSRRVEQAPQGGTQTNRPASSQEDELASFVKVILGSTEDVWHKLFAQYGKQYKEARLVLFTGFEQTQCGPGMAAMGPFYCPLDQTVYIDLAFYRQLRQEFGAPGDFAQAYVIAHEVGHHVQTLLGISERVQAAKSRVGQTQANQIQVRMELQADCLAGVWAHQADREKGILEDGDVEEGLRAAAAIGDDMIQKRTQGRVVPDAFTHGTSEQRVRWFRKGLETGDTSVCDTFNARTI